LDEEVTIKFWKSSRSGFRSGIC